MGRRTPTPEELKKLITDVMQEMGDADLACKTFDGQPNEDLSVEDVLAKFRAIRSNLILSACALAGLDDVEPECIFDVDRPREEWHLLENLDLFEGRCSCGEFHDPLSTSPCKRRPDDDCPD